MRYTRRMYIEFVIADNFLLTYLAGATAARICHKRLRVWRLVLASAVGTAVAVFYPFMRVGFVLQFVIKLSLGAALCVIMFAKTPKPITSSLLFFGCTFAYGGACYAIGLMFYGNSSAAGEFCRKCPLFLVLGTGAAVYLAARYCVKRMKPAHARAPYEYGTDVEVFGSVLHFDAFLDTGNCVFDGKTGLPVIITDAERFSEKLGAAAAIEFSKKLDSLRKIRARTPAGTAEVYIVEPSRITVYSDRHGHKIKAVIGLVGGRKFSGAHEMLLNPAVIAEGV